MFRMMLSRSTVIYNKTNNNNNSRENQLSNIQLFTSHLGNLFYKASVENSDSIENSLHFTEIAIVFTSWRRDGVNQK